MKSLVGFMTWDLVVDGKIPFIWTADMFEQTPLIWTKGPFWWNDYLLSWWKYHPLVKSFFAETCIFFQNFFSARDSLNKPPIETGNLPLPSSVKWRFVFSYGSPSQVILGRGASSVKLLAKLSYFTNLDFPEIRGPISLTFHHRLGILVVWGRELIWPPSWSPPQICVT